MIDLVLNNFTTDREYGADFFRKVIEAVAKEADLESKKIELSINLVGEGRIKSLNKKYRGKNRVTDVLSFPLNHRNAEGSRNTENRNLDQRIISKNELASSGRRNGGIMDLGDIFICLPVAKKYSAREGVSLDYKLSFLTVHGFLHLLGHNHEKSAAEKEKIFTLQDKILKRLATSD